MPELPDVEVFGRHLQSTSLDRDIREVEVEETSLVKSHSAKEFSKRLTGDSFESVSRRGKYLSVKTKRGYWVLFHFGMTGFFQYYEDKESKPDHPRVIFHFAEGGNLAWDCSRKLGEVRLVEDLEAFYSSKNLGPDALQLDRKEFVRLLGNRRGGVKSALMDQSLLSGVGNVYADEALFQAGIHPKASCSTLDESVLADLRKTLYRVLRTAIDRGADPSDMPRTWLLQRREPGADCPGCDGKIKKIRVNGRPTYFCPSCQEKG